MKILITNDDGIDAPGIKALAQELEKEHEITIIAPDAQRSACGHSITLNRNLTIKELFINDVNSKAFSIDGTPADCVRIGVEVLFRPDLVVSGINRGYNLGTDILYSGTVSAAVESAFHNIPSIAISTTATEDIKIYKITASFLVDILKNIKSAQLKSGTVYNINVPNPEKHNIQGIKVCRMGNQIYKNEFIETEANSRSYSSHGKIIDYGSDETDVQYVKKGFITITPLQCDITNYAAINELEKIFK